MAIKTREELEKELEDIKSRLAVIETTQTSKQDEEPAEETDESKTESEVETEDEIEKLLNS